MCNLHHIRTVIALWLCIWPGLAIIAETVTLRSGKVVVGQVILQNDDIIILKDATGARFQFPMNDVEKVEESTNEQTTPQPTKIETETVSKVALRLNVAGGGCFVPDHKKTLGGHFVAEVQIGSRDLMGKRIFVGGSIGYMGVFTEHTYSLVPIKVVTSIPLMDSKHTPEIGMNIGYAIGTRPARGGLTAGIDVNWRYQINSKLVFLLGCDAGFTQVTIPIEEIVNTQTYINHVGRTIVNFGLKTTIQF